MESGALTLRADEKLSLPRQRLGRAPENGFLLKGCYLVLSNCSPGLITEMLLHLHLVRHQSHQLHPSRQSKRLQPRPLVHGFNQDSVRQVQTRKRTISLWMLPRLAGLVVKQIRTRVSGLIEGNNRYRTAARRNCLGSCYGKGR
jgi:hypothetical protein